MGSPTFRFETVVGLREEYDPWDIFSDEGIQPAGQSFNHMFSERRLRLNTFDGNPQDATFHYHRVARAQALRKAIVRIALEEWNYWQIKHRRGRLPEEGDGQEGSRKVTEYWNAVGKNYHTIADLTDPDHPWSAAFISYVMTKAGALPDFTRALKHTKYFFNAKEARRDLYGGLFKAYPSSGIGKVCPEVGDLILNARKGNSASYDNLKPYGYAHSDIVVKKEGGVIVVVGGNVSAGKGKGNKVVGKKYIALNDNGYLGSEKYLRPDGTMSFKAAQYYSVMKIEARTSNLLNPGAKR